MTRVEAIPYNSMKAGMPWNWETFPEYLDAVERTPKGVNILPYFPVGPLLSYVMGLERAKAGEKPTKEETELMCRLLEEGMDAGACGWSAQRLHPDGVSAVQLDYDGTPMVTDVMHDETALAFAEVLGRRNDGFMQMTLTSADVKKDRVHMEELARVSRRPLIYNVVSVFDDRPHVHRAVLKWLDKCHENGSRVYGQALSTDAGFTFTFDEWNLFDDSPAWREATTGTVEERFQKLSDPARREALKKQPPMITIGSIGSIVVVGPKSEETKQWLDHRIGKDRQAPDRRHARHRRGRQPEDGVLRFAAQHASRPDGRNHPEPVHPVRRVGRRRAHAVPDGGPLSDRGDHEVRARAQPDLAGARALQTVGAAGDAGGLPRPWRHQERRSGRHRGL
jgi:hypothetical protein